MARKSRRLAKSGSGSGGGSQSIPESTVEAEVAVAVTVKEEPETRVEVEVEDKKGEEETILGLPFPSPKSQGGGGGEREDPLAFPTFSLVHVRVEDEHEQEQGQGSKEEEEGGTSGSVGGIMLDSFIQGVLPFPEEEESYVQDGQEEGNRLVIDEGNGEEPGTSRDRDQEEDKDKDYDEEDDNLYKFLDSDEDSEDEDEENKGPKQRSSYSGIRGPRADVKALNLVSSCPVSFKWLMNNFEYCSRGRSLPRGFVYDQYVLLMHEKGLEPVNAASFGKLIRSVFPGLKTRRLGTRGNSKYHYNGVYLKENSPLMAIFNLVKSQQGLNYDGTGKRGKKIRRPDLLDSDEELVPIMGDDSFFECSVSDYLGKVPEHGCPKTSLLVDVTSLPQSVDPQALSPFEDMYVKHCNLILGHFAKFELRQVFEEWKRFWRIKSNIPDRNSEGSYKNLMSKTTLFKICALPKTQEFIRSMDLYCYQQAITILFPSLVKGMPVSMINGMRNFLRDVDYVFYTFLNGYPKAMAEIKLKCIRAFVAMFNDFSKLNRLMRANASTLRNGENIQAMVYELNRAMDFLEMEKQMEDYAKPTAELITDVMIMTFARNLEQSIEAVTSPNPMSGWITWAEYIAMKTIQECERKLSAGEMSQVRNPFVVWKNASDKIMGAAYKGNAASHGVFKGFLTWCDSLVQQITRIRISEVQGFEYPSFYYETHLPEQRRVQVQPQVLYRPMITNNGDSIQVNFQPQAGPLEFDLASILAEMQIPSMDGETVHVETVEIDGTEKGDQIIILPPEIGS